VETIKETKKGDKKEGDNNFLPDIKDYHRIIERGLDRMNGLNKLGVVTSKTYDEWCHLVKLCFEGSDDNPAVNVSMIELIRLHPVLNKMSFYGVRDLLTHSHLVKLRPN
jgi:hypothetical protein